MKIYYDTFEGEYTTKKNISSPPERYYEIVPHDINEYIERWMVSNNNERPMENISYNISILYDKIDKDSNLIYKLRKNKEIECNCKLLYLSKYIVPRKEFEIIYNYIKENIISYDNYMIDDINISLKDLNLNRIEYFSSFKDDWDDEGAEPFNEEYMKYIKEIINIIDDNIQPEVFPCKDGIIQFEWENVRSNFYLELKVLGNDNYDIYYIIRDIECMRDRFVLNIEKEILNCFLYLVLKKVKI